MRLYQYLLSFSVLVLYQSIYAKQTPIEYINKWKETAMNQMRTHKIPASITLAQGCLESSYGNSRLATEGNNHFGIKCKKSWTGKVIYADDDAVGECFRAYDNAASSYRDHSLFLQNNPRYAFLFQLSISDYQGWAKGLRKAGYATNPKYPALLIRMIERYNLAKYDSLVLGLFESREKINGILATRLKEDQTLAQIAAVNERTERRVRKLNDLKEGQAIDPGDVVYLRRKKRKAYESYHEVIAGESLWSISQQHAIKLKRIYKLNKLDEGSEVAGGQVLNLRHKVESSPTLRTKRSNIIDNIIKNENPIVFNEPTKNHIVKSGETLYSIARMYQTGIDTLRSINLLKSAVVALGQTLKVPDRGLPQKVDENKVDTTESIFHIVSQGETLYYLSRKYQTSIEAIKLLNNMETNELSIGSKIKIK